ncbi:hypothetical protein HMPREF1982_00387 [Clostridiales bacterium oral taxon 876 str. F0540]|nr:hypothetical protein HMPREF1982_00387 [Clostridiales bacterium oral taxon 876 str. F0540]
MRFIYLSTTKEKEYETKESTINSFKDYLKGSYRKFHISDGKIDKSKFDVGEDIFFLRAEKVLGYYTYKVVAYCKSNSEIRKTENDDLNVYPFYFEINSDTLRIFIEGIDIKYFQNFINDTANNIKKVNFTGSIKGNEFNGPSSWIYFDKEDSSKIMEWFRRIVIEENIQMLCNL